MTGDCALLVALEVLEVGNVAFGSEVQDLYLGGVLGVVFEEEDEVAGLELVDFELFDGHLHQLVQLLLELLFELELQGVTEEVDEVD